MGLTLSNEEGDVENYLTWGYINDYFMFNLGANYENFRIASSRTEKSLFTFLGQLGLRNRLHKNLFVSYGVSGTSEHKKTPQLRYSVGAFVGLDLQISRHFLLSGKINPFCFTHHQNGDKYYQSFETGSVSLAYVF